MRRRSLSLIPLLLALLAVFSDAQAPVPFVNQPLVPDATAPGGRAFTLTVNGTGFAPGSVVKWNKDTLATQFVSSSQLTATVPAAEVATKGTASVTVLNPALGGGTSNVAFFAVTGNVGSDLAFYRDSSPDSGYFAQAMVAGDFNGDGKLDLAVANAGSNTVSILLSDGRGNFTSAASVDVESSSPSMAMGDFNGDGKVDLAVANSDGDHISILLGDGTGNFTSIPSPSTRPGTSAVAVGDFNGDGNLDLAYANVQSPTVSVLLGDGAGNFARVWQWDTLGWSSSSLAMGDFNGDGKLDLAVVGSEPTQNHHGRVASVQVLLGGGTGAFSLSWSSGLLSGYGAEATFAAVGDFNGDGKLDLAVAASRPTTGRPRVGTVDVLLGDGTGNFGLVSRPRAGVRPVSVSVGDFNGDDKLDLAVADSMSSVVVLLGDGSGNFTQVGPPIRHSQSAYMAVGDFNGDGRLDLAIQSASIFLQVPASPAIQMVPPSLSFGSQLLHTASTPQTARLINISGTDFQIASIATSGDFLGPKYFYNRVASGEARYVNVVFRPLRAGPQSGTLNIVDSSSSNSQTVALTGVGTVVSLEPTSADFGGQEGTTSSPRTITLTNHAGHVLTISGFQFVGANPRSFAQTNTCGTSVAPWSSCTISVTFTPLGKGPKSATLNIRDNGGDSPQEVTLIGNSPNGTIHVATGLDCSNNLITAGGTNDCHWTVNGNPAQVVAPGFADWNDYFPSNGPNSSWIAIDANNASNGPAPYSFNLVFDLTGSNPSTVSLSGLWSIDDTGTLSLNGHQIGALNVYVCCSLHSFSVPAGSPYFRRGLNRLTITMTATDNYLEGVRLEGTIRGVAER